MNMTWTPQTAAWKKTFLSLVITLSLFFTGTGSITADEIKPSLLLAPFSILSDGDFGFLETAVNRMLNARLGTSFTLVPADTNTITSDSTARNAGISAKADWVLYGSITIIGDQISTDATLIPLPSGDLIHFSQTGKSRSEVIPHINSLAQTVIDAKGLRPAPVSSGQAETVKSANETETSATKPSVPPAPITQTTSAVTTGEWKSRVFSEAIHVLGTGDFSGDGITDIVTGTDDTIAGYTFSQGHLAKQFSHPVKHAKAVVSCDLMDADNDGITEIYASWITTSNRIRSAVFIATEHRQLRAIEENLPWLIRVTRGPEGKPILVGQKADSLSHDLSTPVQALAWKNGHLDAAAMDLPDDINVTGFTYGPINSQLENGILAIAGGQELQAFTISGQLQWKSGDRYGGNPLYIPYPDPEDPETEKHAYLRQRILVRDMDNDRIPEVLVARNTDMAGGFLAKMKMFKDGSADLLSWKPSGLASEWSTIVFTGYVSDLAIGDLDNDMHQEIIIAVISGTGVLGKNKQTTLYRYPLQ